MQENTVFSVLNALNCNEHVSRRAGLTVFNVPEPGTLRTKTAFNVLNVQDFGTLRAGDNGCDQPEQYYITAYRSTIFPSR